MKAFKVLNNQSGMMAMMGAMIFTIAITTTLSTFYVYTLNQAKYHARIKEAYQLINIMESFATATRKAYDSGMSAAATPGGACPGTNAAPVLIAGTADKYYCATNAETCFRREDTNEEYCSTVSFASNVTIKKKTSYAEAKTKTFLKSWRKGLNEFYLSPGLKQRVIDSDTILSSVIQKPRLLDWLAPKAYAQAKNEVAEDNKQTIEDDKYVEDEGTQPVTPGSVVTQPTRPVVIYPSPTPDGEVTPPVVVNPTPTPAPNPGGSVVTVVSYVNCAMSTYGSMCTSTTGGSSGGDQKNNEPGEDQKHGETQAGNKSVYGDGQQGGPSTGSTGGYAVVTCHEMAAGNSYCSYCRPGEFCPSVGGTPNDGGGIRVMRDGEDVRKPLPIRQKFSIIM